MAMIRAGIPLRNGTPRNHKGVNSPRATVMRRLDSETLRHLYLDERLTYQQIAEQYDCHWGTVMKLLARYGIERLDGAPRKKITVTTTRHGNNFKPSVRRFILKRDNYHCQMPGCGASEDLETHHIVPIEFGGSRESVNGIVLCHSCHQLVTGEEMRHASLFQAIVLSKLPYTQTCCIGEHPIKPGNTEGTPRTWGLRNDYTQGRKV